MRSICLTVGLVGGLAAVLAGCNGDAELQQQRAEERRAIENEMSDESIFDLFRNQSEPDRQVAVNRYLWQASLDVLSNGRTRLVACAGGGAGPLWEAESAALGVAPDERRKRMVENIRVLRHLWTRDGEPFQGRYTTFSNVTLEPKPVQSPCPIWLATNAERLARGDGGAGLEHTAKAGKPHAADLVGFLVTCQDEAECNLAGRLLARGNVDKWRGIGSGRRRLGVKQRGSGKKGNHPGSDSDDERSGAHTRAHPAGELSHRARRPDSLQRRGRD